MNCREQRVHVDVLNAEIRTDMDEPIVSLAVGRVGCTDIYGGL